MRLKYRPLLPAPLLRALCRATMLACVLAAFALVIHPAIHVDEFGATDGCSLCQCAGGTDLPTVPSPPPIVAPVAAIYVAPASESAPISRHLDLSRIPRGPPASVFSC